MTKLGITNDDFVKVLHFQGYTTLDQLSTLHPDSDDFNIRFDSLKQYADTHYPSIEISSFDVLKEYLKTRYKQAWDIYLRKYVTQTFLELKREKCHSIENLYTMKQYNNSLKPLIKISKNMSFYEFSKTKLRMYFNFYDRLRYFQL